MTVDMFDPLSDSGAKVVPLRAPEWRIILPVPEGAPAPPTKHPKLGAPAGSWEYRARGGRVLGHVCRFDAPDGGKEIRSLVFAEHRKWGRQWRWLGFPKPRSLYRLDRLAARPEAPVIVTEGEKAADAAAELLPDHVAVTSPGGSKASGAADWSPLAGRGVRIWPDADEPGQAYARDVLDMLATLSPAPTVAVVQPPAGVAEGWDAADALAEGWTPALAAEMIAKAVPASGEGAAASRSSKSATRELLLDLLGEAELWHDPERIAYATVAVDGHRENHELGSDGFKNWSAWRAYEAIGIAPAAEAIEAALRVARGLALNRGRCCKTWRRVAEHEGRIYLDLGCPRWRAVEIDSTGWRIVEAAPIKFLRSRGMEPLPEPEAGETIELLREFINVESDADFRLFLASLAAALRPGGPFPILILIGQQGASKSTLARIYRRLVYPNASPIRSVPKSERDLFVSAYNSWLLVYDNLSGVPAWLSDAFCRLSTGGGFATRQLQSDRDETIFAAQRPIVLNGIGDLAERADLTDRALSITLPLIRDEHRREEREFWAAFEAARPKIVGALLHAVAAGLRHLPDTRLDRRPRMADFATWAEACASGFGWEPGEFLRDYEENRSDAVAAAAEASPLVPAIEGVLARIGVHAAGFEGTATELLGRLGEVCSEAERRARWYPATASQVGSRLRRIAPLLRSRGIEFRSHKDTAKKRTRLIILRCVSEAAFGELRARTMGRLLADRDQPPH
jgi:putative DNA primase/helicase